MYSPYDNIADEFRNELSQETTSSTGYTNPYRAIIGAGYLAVTGAAGVGMAYGAVRGTHRNLMRQSPRYSAFDAKVRGSDFYKGVVPLFSKMSNGEIGGAMGFYTPSLRATNIFDDWLYARGGKRAALDAFSPKKSGLYGFKGETPAIRAAKIQAMNDFTKHGKQISVRASRVLKIPMMPGISAAMSVSTEFENNSHPSSLSIGLAREALGQPGAVIGSQLGAMVGLSALGGVGGIVGGIGGGIAGYMIGSSVVDMVGWMKKMGRQWSRPDTAGGFQDSSGAMTMRARSLNAIRTSQFNVRSSLGDEASRLYFGT